MKFFWKLCMLFLGLLFVIRFIPQLSMFFNENFKHNWAVIVQRYTYRKCQDYVYIKREYWSTM